MLNLVFINRLLARRRAVTMVMAAAFGLGVLLSGADPGIDRLLQAARDGLLGNTALSSMPRHVGPLPLLALAMLLVVVCARSGSRLWRAVAFAAGTLVICLVIPLVSERLVGLSMEVAPATATLAGAALVAAAIRAADTYRARALLDSATGLPNLVALAEAASEGMVLLVVARLERFGAIAVGLGQQSAAKVISRVADRLVMANHQRPVYRIDDVSLAWIERPGDRDTLEDRLEAIARIMRSPVDCGQLVDITLNLGMARCDDGDARQALANASLAATDAADKGLRWTLFSGADVDEDTDYNLSLLSELDAAMTSGQLWNAYQPQMDLVTGRIIGVEALVRWLHPQRGPIAPDNFIPLVEKHGRARDLTLHVLARALEDAVQWEAAGMPIGIAVNASASLLADSDFIELVRRALSGSAVRPERITIEVTETAAMHDPEMGIAALVSWRETGVNISIDDYGTGQSTLNYLQQLPATELKIDQGFIRGIGSDERNAIMVRSTIALAHELGIKVVAEGIEDAECLRQLTEMGCDTGQGYHIGRPMSASNLRVFLVGSAIQAA